jgi:DnaA family protein
VVKEQLPLGFTWRYGIRFDDFVTGTHAALLHCLRDCAAGHGEQFVYLWGGEAAGKSHLLQAACQAAAERGATVAYLPLADLAAYGPEIFEGLESLALVCVDDLQTVLGRPEWEEALFHFYNRLRAAQTALVAAGDSSPAALQMGLADLRSRLAWGPVFRLDELSDAEKISALQLRAKVRGFELPNEVAQFLIRRSPRDMTSLFALLDRLDRESLAQQRRLTIPFVRTLI